MTQEAAKKKLFYGVLRSVARRSVVYGNASNTELLNVAAILLSLEMKKHHGLAIQMLLANQAAPDARMPHRGNHTAAAVVYGTEKLARRGSCVQDAEQTHKTVKAQDNVRAGPATSAASAN